jgi:multiple sugar transport system ATP-binding protein
MAKLVVENLTKRFGNVTAVDRLSFVAEDREFLVLIGPSGCGKSTTLSLIAGLDEATEGRICIGERPVTHLHPKDRDIAMVFQSYALYPHMNVYANMAFGLSMRGYSKAEIDRRIREAAEILGIGDLLMRKPKALSGGQRQRVAVGRAIVRKPAVFLFDEPLSNLDAKLRVQMRAELSKLHQRLNSTIVYVTHDQVEAMTMATRIVLLKDGVCQQIGRPLELYSRPVNTFTAGFIGTPPMNLLPVRIEEVDGCLMAAAGCFRLPIPHHLQTAYEGLKGRDAIFGIRPEHLRGVREDAAPTGAAPAAHLEVDLVEMLGSHVQLTLQCGAGRLIAVADPALPVAAGDRIPVAFDMNAMHLFEKVAPHRRISADTAAPQNPNPKTAGGGE